MRLWSHWQKVFWVSLIPRPFNLSYLCSNQRREAWDQVSIRVLSLRVCKPENLLALVHCPDSWIPRYILLHPCVGISQWAWKAGKTGILATKDFREERSLPGDSAQDQPACPTAGGTQSWETAVRGPDQRWVLAHSQTTFLLLCLIPKSIFVVAPPLLVT